MKHPSESRTRRLSKDGIHSRRVARLHSVQALFQMEASGQVLGQVLAEFEEHRLGAQDDDVELGTCDAEFFRTLVAGAANQQARIDQMIDKALVDKWPIHRIDPTLRALFRSAGAELLENVTTPKIVINEFVEVSKAFFPEGREPRFVNGVLDSIAREARPEYFA